MSELPLPETGGRARADNKEKISRRESGRNTVPDSSRARKIPGISGITLCETGTPGKGARFTIMVQEGGCRPGGAAASRQG
ncbi:MAG: hypothetical protein EHM53_10555 [Methanoregulaceae archaeon]|nr:MAG: hypothetical protein EHM53_10555 [Methanoregulaceae archaeon]